METETAEDAEPTEAVYVQYGLLLQAPNCVYVALTACRAGAGVEAVRLCSRGNTPVNAWSAVQTHYVALSGASSSSELVLSRFYTAVHTTHSPALLSTHKAAYHTCSPISA